MARLTTILTFGVWVDLNNYSVALAFFVEFEGTATNEFLRAFRITGVDSEQRLSNHG